MSQRLALVLALVAGVATSFVVSPGLSRRGVHGRPRRALADGASSRGAAVSAAGAAGQGEEHREYLTSVASVEAPARLEVLLEVLLASDPSLEPMAPTTRGGGVHPLVIPLAQNKTGHFGLLRAPTAARADPLPVVWCSADHGGMTLQCTNSDNFVVGLAVEADHEEDAAAEALIETANKGLEYEEAYEMGSVRNFGRGLPRYLIMRVGQTFPSAYFELASEHMGKGDSQSALITAEKIVGTFGEFGSSYLFQAQLLDGQPNYDLEARDAARNALRRPLWSVSHDAAAFKDAVRISEKEGGMAALLEDFRRLAANDRAEEVAAGKTSAAAVALERAGYLLDVTFLAKLAGAEDAGNWDDVRDELADLYEAAGAGGMAKMVR